jgi:hypothetical protein
MWSNNRSIQQFRQEFGNCPGQTPDDYLFRIAKLDGCPLRFKAERQKFRYTVLNKELDSGSLRDIAPYLSIEEHPKKPGQPRSKPSWATTAIAEGRIKRPVEEAPEEPSGAEHIPDNLKALLYYAQTEAKGTSYEPRIQLMAEHIALGTADPGQELELLASMAGKIKSLEKIVHTDDHLKDLYERQISTIKEDHQKDLRLLEYELTSPLRTRKAA